MKIYKKIIYSLIILITAYCLLFSFKTGLAASDLGKKLAGRFLIQVQFRGQAWYINPADLRKYYLGRPDDAFSIMRRLGVGITNDNLAKIPLAGANAGDLTFAKANAGKIFLQVQSKGEAWYVNPVDYKRYYLGRPADAFNLMRQFGLGITNSDLDKILIGYLKVEPSTSTPPVVPPVIPPSPETDQVMSAAAAAIRSGGNASAYFTDNMKNVVDYTVNYLDSAGRLELGNILSGAKLSASSDSQKTYSTKVYFSLGGYEVSLYFHLQKQADGKWLLGNL